MLRRVLACVLLAASCLAAAGCASGNRTLDHEVTVTGLIMKVPSSWEEQTSAEDAVRFAPADDGDDAIVVSYEEGYQAGVDAYRYMLDRRHEDEEQGIDREWSVAREMRLNEWTCNVYDVKESSATDGEDVTYQRAVIYGPTATYEIDVYGDALTMDLLLKTVGFE